MTTNCSQLKMIAPDGKMRFRDALDTKGILRLIESVPSPKYLPFLKKIITFLNEKYKRRQLWIKKIIT